MTEAIKYPASVFWSDEDGGFIAIAPDLPGCSAFGKTQGDALAELQDAISGWVEAARAVGNPVPELSPKPEPERYSGKLVLRLPRSLHAKLATTAKQDGVSLNQHLLHLLATASARSDTMSGLRIVIVAPVPSGESMSTASGTGPVIDPAIGSVAPLGSARTTH
jgi:predicted RNase H-like HicB family nuclease